MEKLPNTIRARLNAAQAGEHPDANLLAAFAEQTLLDREREQVLTHLSRCADCRDVIALAAPVITPAALDTRNARGVSWFSWPVLRWSALAACVVIVGTAVLLNRQSMSMKTAAVREVDILAAQPSTRPASGYGYTASNTNNAITEEKLQTAVPGRVHSGKAKPTMAAPPPAFSDLATDKNVQSLDRLKKDEDGGLAGQRGAAIANVAGGLLATQPKPPAPVRSAVAPATRDDNKAHAFEGQDEAKSVPASNASPTPEQLKTSQTVEVSAQNEMVTVESAAPAQPEREPGKAKQATGAAAGRAMSYGVLTDSVTLRKEAGAAAAERARGAFAPATRWTISSDGQLQHSIDAGKSWQPMVVADNATFRALSFNGPDVWVGGASGLLFHSADSGGHWMKVTPIASGAILVADIAAIEFTDPRHGKVTTAKGEVWLTDDGGQSWRKQS